MTKIISILAILFTFNITAIANVEKSAVQSQIQSEFGNCYNKFQTDLAYCQPSICYYPDLTDSKAWRAQAIRGIVNEKCYVIYYSYVGDKTVGEPDHCYYTKMQMNILTDYYRNLFKTNSVIESIDLKDKINEFSAYYNSCKKMPKKEDQPQK